jgi:signal transduction histidine kinase/ligand-binding sensor domain-containing protein
MTGSVDERTPKAVLRIGCTLVCLALFLPCSRSFSLDPGRYISQYGHTVWRTQDGFFSAPNAITQTTDGYIWIGTLNGLVRFDGVRFVPWTALRGQTLRDQHITSLLGSRDGSLWIGTSSGLSRFKDGQLLNYSSTPVGISDILEDHSGTIWVTRYRVRDGKGPLCRVAGKELQCYGKPDGLPFGYAVALGEDTLGNLWIGSYMLSRWRPGSSTLYFEEELKHLKGDPGVLDVAAGPSGSVWAALEGTGPKLGVRHFADGKWSSYVVKGFDGSHVRAHSLFADRDGSLWVGGETQGLYRIHDGVADHYGRVDGLAGDSVNAIYQDREGNLWVATHGGVDFFRDTPVVTFSMREGLSADAAGSVQASRDGVVWVGNEEALNVLRDGTISAIGASHGLPGRDVTSLFEDHTHRLWLGVSEKVVIYEKGRFIEVSKPDGSALATGGDVQAITEDTDHNIWVLTADTVTHHMFRIQDEQVREEIPLTGIQYAAWLAADKKAGIWMAAFSDKLARYRDGHLDVIALTTGTNSLKIRDIIVDSDNSVWAATTDGLFRWKEGRLDKLNDRNGLPCNTIFSMIKDNRGSYWLYAQCGLLKIAESEVANWRDRPDSKVKVEIFDGLDAVQTGATNSQPKASRSPDGRLWFVNSALLQMIDPDHLYRNNIPPPVHVEELVADHVIYPPLEHLSLPALTRDLEIDYTALSFTVPRRVRFRYRLEGHDRDWQEPGTRRQAFYNDLAPGNYQFHVIACNNDGVWNEAGAVLDFVVIPAYYQTLWFKLFCGVVALGFVWFLYFLRMKQATEQIHARLEERLIERERIARELHDTLLQGFHGLMLRFQAVLKQIPDREPARRMLESTLDRADEVLLEGRERVQNLRAGAITVVELPEALASCGQELAEEHEVTFSIAIMGKPQTLDLIVREEAYRIGREAMINAFQHSRASKIELEITYESKELRLRIRDDGGGIDQDVLNGGRPGHWGLSGMRERAKNIGSQLSIWSRAGAGTEVDLKVPSKIAYPRGPRWLSGNWIKSPGSGGQ